MNLEEKVDLLARRVYQLEQEVQQLKNANGMNAVHDSTPVYQPETPGVINTAQAGREMPGFANASPVRQEMPVNPGPGPVPQNMQRAYNPAPVNNFNAQAKEGAPKKSLEGKIGKTVMGVMASVLIFISIILFAKIFYEYIPDIAKAGIMFAVSLIMATVGLLKMSKDNKYYVLFTSIAGCGVGAVFIVCMVSFFIFGLYSELVLFVLIGVWLVCTLILARAKSDVFAYICNVGLAIATFMAAAEWPTGYLSLILYLIIISALFILKQKHEWQDYIYFFQVPAISYLLCECFEFTNIPVVIVMTVLMIALLIFVNLRFYRKKLRKDSDRLLNVIFSVEMFIFINAFIASASDLIYDAVDATHGFTPAGIMKYDFGSILNIIVSLGILYLYYRLYYNERELTLSTDGSVVYPAEKLLFYFVFGMAALWLPPVSKNLIAGEYFKYAPAFIILLIAGILLKDKYIRYTGYFWSAMFLFTVPSGYLPTFWTVITAFVIYILLGVVIMRKTYSALDKYILTGISVIYSVVLINSIQAYIVEYSLIKYSNDYSIYDLELGYISFAMIACISMLMNTKLYHFSPDHVEEPVSKRLGLIFNAVVLVFGTVLLMFGEKTDIPATITLVLFVPALSVINLKRIFSLNINRSLLGIYTCFKYMIITIAFLKRFDAISYVVSIIGILLAIVFIAGGFRFKIKSSRIYGIVLTMICIVKLIIVDISYSSTALRPVGFFIAGILCFGISMLYSKLEKNIN